MSRAAAVLLAALVFAVPSTASAMPIGRTTPAPTAPTLAPAPATPTGTTGGSSGGLLGSTDTTTALGGEDASCAHLAGSSAEVQRNCNSTGLSESSFPPSNYGLDVHVDTGITDPLQDIAAGFQQVVSWIYQSIAHILTWTLLGLGLAFGFDLFAGDKGGQIHHGLTTAQSAFSSPLLPVVLIVGGAVGFFYWLGHNEGRALGHWAAMLALMAVGLLIAADPVGMLGWADQASNGISSGALAAFTGTGGGTSNGFSNAVPGIYRTTMEEPWCSIEFGAVSWCMAPVDAKMGAARQQVLQHLDKALGDQGTPELAKQQAPIERQRLANARTNGELFLAFPVNSNARNGQNDNWTFYHALLQDRPDLTTIRGPGGVGERLVIFLLAGCAGLAFLILLLYIAWQLIVASVFFVLCLALTPVALLTPAFGEGGRRVFLRWFMWMGESLLKRVIFAVYLGVILFVTRIFLSVANTQPILQGWLIQWLILAAIWVMAIVYRHKILDVMTAGTYHHHMQPGVARMGGNYAARRYWRRVPQATTVAGDEYHQQTHEHYYGDQYHAHAYVGGNGHSPERAQKVAADVIDGHARELSEPPESE